MCLSWPSRANSSFTDLNCMTFSFLLGPHPERSAGQMRETANAFLPTEGSSFFRWLPAVLVGVKRYSALKTFDLVKSLDCSGGRLALPCKCGDFPDGEPLQLFSRSRILLEYSGQRNPALPRLPQGLSAWWLRRKPGRASACASPLRPGRPAAYAGAPLSGPFCSAHWLRGSTSLPTEVRSSPLGPGGRSRSGAPAWEDGVHSLYRHSDSALDLQKIPGALHIPADFPLC